MKENGHKMTSSSIRSTGLISIDNEDGNQITAVSRQDNVIHSTTATKPKIAATNSIRQTSRDAASKNSAKIANGRIRTSPIIKISSLDTEGNKKEFQQLNSLTKIGCNKALGKVVIVATTPETTFYSEEIVPFIDAANISGE